MSENFIRYEYKCPDVVFTQRDIDFMETLDGDFTEHDRAKIGSLEFGLYNKTTGVSTFHTIPGIRKLPHQRSIYFSRFSSKSYRLMRKEFGSQYTDRIDEGNKCKSISLPYRIITPDRMMFYAWSYWGDLDMQEAAFCEAANDVGAKLARFSGRKFMILGSDMEFDFSDITIEEAGDTKTVPKGW